MDYLLLSVVVAVTVLSSVISCCLIASLCMYRCQKHVDDPEDSQDPKPSNKMRTDDCKFSVVQEKHFYSLIETSDGTNSSETSSQCESSEYEKESGDSSEYERESVESSEFERETEESSENEKESDESSKYEREFQYVSHDSCEKLSLLNSSISNSETDITISERIEAKVISETDQEELEKDVLVIDEDNDNNLDFSLHSLNISQLFQEHDFEYQSTETDPQSHQYTLDVVDIGTQMTDSSFILIESPSPSLNVSSNQFLRNLTSGKNAQPLTLFGILNKFSQFYCLGVDLRNHL